MIKIIALLFIFFISGQCLLAQQPLRIIKATSNAIKILDGDDLREGGLVPRLKPDVYVYHKSGNAKRIVYYTNIDSIAFTVNPGDTYDFAVLLNNKDTCYQRISAENPDKVTYATSSEPAIAANDTIPFYLGENNAIHIRGRLNNSDTLDLIFDTGANVGVLSEEGSAKKAALNKDNKNRFQFAGITIENSPAIFVNYNGGLKADGVIGYNAFEDKIVEINYDKSVMVVHASMDDISKSYTVNEMVWRGENMFIAGILNINNKKHKGLFLFDTGSKWALSVNKAFAAANGLYNKMTEVGTRQSKGVNGKAVKSTTVMLPELLIGDLSLTNVPIDLESPSGDAGLDKNILGNDVLKRFNVVLDYKSGLIYLRPNNLLNAPYNKSYNASTIFIAVGIFAALVIAGLLIYRRRKKP